MRAAFEAQEETLVRLITDLVMEELERLSDRGEVDTPAQLAVGPGPSSPGYACSCGEAPAFLASPLLPDGIPIGVSVRHIHLCREDCDALFGPGHKLKHLRELYQRDQFACEETLTVVGPKGCLGGMRVLAPLRKKTQVEVARTDAVQLGVMPELSASVNEGKGSPCALAGPAGSIILADALIRMRRHIHLSTEEAASLGLKDGDQVDVRIPGAQGVVLCSTLIRAHPDFRAEMHLDTDEANATGIC